MEQSQKNKIEKQPLSTVRWVPRVWLIPNEWNPNYVALPELQLLKISLLENGWTQPIVVFEREKTKLVIVDGENRWRTSEDAEVGDMTGDLVPVVTLRGTEEDLMIATVRHNRARGEHGVVPMAKIVTKLLEKMPPEEVERRLQMEDEEVNRLSERDGSPVANSRGCEGFQKGWIPGHE